MRCKGSCVEVGVDLLSSTNDEYQVEPLKSRETTVSRRFVPPRLLAWLHARVRSKQMQSTMHHDKRQSWTLTL